MADRGQRNLTWIYANVEETHINLGDNREIRENRFMEQEANILGQLNKIYLHFNSIGLILKVKPDVDEVCDSKAQ